MNPGDLVRLKDDHNVMLNYGDVGFQIVGGAEGTIMQTNSHDSRCLVGFKVNNYIVLTAWLHVEDFKVIG